MADYEDAPWTTDEHAQVEGLLRAAGWYPGRDERSQIASWRAQLEAGGRFRLHATAETVLAEFGGLHVGDNKPGVQRSRTDIRFDPTAAWGMDDFVDLPELQGRSVFPLGDVTHGHGVLLLDSTGEAFLAMDDVDAHWPTFHAALYSLLLGRRQPVNTQRPSGSDAPAA